MRDLKDNSEVLEDAYRLVEAALDRRLAALVDLGEQELATLDQLLGALGPHARARSQEARSVARHVAWAPITRTCVTALLRAIIASSGDSPVGTSTRVTEDSLRPLKDRLCDPAFAARLGIAITDARVAIDATGDVLLGPELFAQRRRLVLREVVYEISRCPGWLDVRRLQDDTAGSLLRATLAAGLWLP